MRHEHRANDRAASAAVRRGFGARWVDLSLRGKGLIVVAIPMSALLAAAPLSYLPDADATRGRARVLIAALFAVGLGGGVLATLAFTSGLVRRVDRLSEAARARPGPARPAAAAREGRGRPAGRRDREVLSFLTLLDEAVAQR